MITSKTQQFAKANEDRKRKGLPPIPYGDWEKEQLHSRVSEVIKYLDLDREGPNRGTRNKQELMKRLLYYVSAWGEGSYDEWISKLGTRLGLSPRTVRENYINPLIKDCIIKREGSQLLFVGVPEANTDGA